MATCPLHLLRADSGLRPPTWRWDLARVLHDRRVNLPDVTEPGVEMAAKLQAAAARGDPIAVAEALAPLGAAADAYAFWLSGTTARAGPNVEQNGYVQEFGALNPPAMALAEIEALMLAGKSADLIARRTGLTPVAVRWYEALWFDVRDRLRNPGWVSTHVIGTLHQGTLGTLLPALVRAYGYYTKSARVVAAAVSGFDAPAARAAAQSPHTFFAADATSAGSLKAALAVRLMPLTDRRTHARVVELHQEATRISADAALAAGSADENKLRDAVAYFAKQIKMEYGRAPDPELPQLGPGGAAPEGT